MTKPLLHKRFYYLWGTQTTANAADVLYIVALTVLVLNQTDSLISATFVPLFRAASQMISGFIAPLLIDRFRLPSLLLLSQAGQFIFFTALAVYLGLMGDAASLVVIFPLVFLMSFLDGWTVPVRNALVPRLVNADAGLLKANGYLSVSDQVVQFAGWGLGGLVVAMIGSGPTLLFTMIIYGAAAFLTIWVKEPTNEQEGERPVEKVSQLVEAEQPALEERTKWSTLLEGWTMIWRSPKLRVLTFMDVIDMLGGSVWVGAFMLAFVQQVLQQGEEWWGFLNAAYFAGTVAGGVLVIALVKRINAYLFPAMLFGMIVYSVLTLFYAFNTQPYSAIGLVLVYGPFVQLTVVTRRTLIQRSVDKTGLPKVMAAQAALLHFIFCISLLVMAWIAETFGIVNLYLFASGLTCLAALTGVLFRKTFNPRPDSGEGIHAETTP
jgi:MFS family permease